MLEILLSFIIIDCSPERRLFSVRKKLLKLKNEIYLFFWTKILCWYYMRQPSTPQLGVMDWLYINSNYWERKVLSIRVLDITQKKILIQKLDQMTKDELIFHEMSRIIADHHLWRLHELRRSKKQLCKILQKILIWDMDVKSEYLLVLHDVKWFGLGL